jgi:HEAT repeat protein
MNRKRNTTVLEAYCGSNHNIPEVWQFAEQIFKSDANGELRASVIRARSQYGDLSGIDALQELLAIARTDKDPPVRGAALYAVHLCGGGQLEFFLERARIDDDGGVRSSAVRLVDSLGHPDRSWFIERFVDDPVDHVRGAALDWLLNKKHSVSDRELYSLLLKEVARVDPRYTAARAASVALGRWPNDQEVSRLALNMVRRLPENSGGWKSHLRTVLSKRGLDVDAPDTRFHMD